MKDPADPCQVGMHINVVVQYCPHALNNSETQSKPPRRSLLDLIVFFKYEGIWSPQSRHRCPKPRCVPCRGHGGSQATPSLDR